MTNEAYTAIQMAPFTAPPIRSYQWLRFGSVDVTFKGCLLDRSGQSIGNFELTIGNAAVTLQDASVKNPSTDFPTINAVGAIGRLSGPVYCNTGVDPTDDSVVITLDDERCWVEPANERYMIGVVMV